MSYALIIGGAGLSYGRERSPCSAPWETPWRTTPITAYAKRKPNGFRLMKQVNKAAGRGTTRQEQDNTWEPAIYWQFIRKDRNLLLHEARSTVATAATIDLTHISIRTTSTGEQVPVFPAPQPAQPIYSYTMSTPPYARRDARDVVEEAIRWWEQQIDEIEKDAI